MTDNIETSTKAALTAHADVIRSLGKRVIADVTEVGRWLTQAKKLVGHGGWLPWLDREFGWTEKTAERFMQCHALAKSDKLSNLSLPVSSLYLLAAPSTPDDARDAVIERARAGETISVAETKRVISDAKGRQKPARKTTTKPPPVSEEVLQQRAPAAKRIRALMGGQKRYDVGPDSTNEVARLKARIEELHHQLALRDERIASLERQVAEGERRIRELTRQVPAANEQRPTSEDDEGIPPFLRRPQ